MLYVNDIFSKAAKLFGINSNEIGYYLKEDNSKPILSSIFKNTALPAELFESYGTQRFIKIFPIILEAVKGGKTLVVDELDCAIHPMAIMNIINIFHNDDINVNHAQLIFNTHNPIFLNSSIFRNNEIKFVERNDDNHQSTLYSLSDFNGVRTNEDYMKNYFVSQYGAIKDIDFSPVFEEALINKKEEN